MEVVKQVESLIEDIVKDNDCYIYDIEYVYENGDWYLRIYVDKNEGGLDLETCVVLSEAIGQKLDEEDPIPGEYMLEVSSPGCERPLKNYEQVLDSIGEYVYVKLRDPKAGMSDFYGTILSINEDKDIEFQYLVKNIKKKIVVSYNNISFIRLAVKF